MVPLAKFDIFLKNPPPRFGAILYRKLAEVSYDFFPNGKLKEFTEKHGNLCGGERSQALIRLVKLAKHYKCVFYQSNIQWYLGTFCPYLLSQLLLY